jgi:hypothetical protein
MIPIANATLVNEEEVVEAKPVLEGFQALVQNKKRFKYLVASFLLVLLAVIM